MNPTWSFTNISNDDLLDFVVFEEEIEFLHNLY